MMKTLTFSKDVCESGKIAIVNGSTGIVMIQSVIFFAPNLKEPVNQISKMTRCD